MEMLRGRAATIGSAAMMPKQKESYDMRNKEGGGVGEGRVMVRAQVNRLISAACAMSSGNK